MSTNSTKEAILQALSCGAPLKFRELRRIANSSVPIRELVEAGAIERLPMGIYALPQRDTTWDNLSTLCAAHPSAVICLASAAAYHGLTTQNPYQVWAAFPYNQSVPSHSELSVRGFRWKENSMTAGVETVRIASVEVKMTNPARTVVDLLRSMNRTGETEVAMEALRQFNGRPSDLIKIADVLGCRKSITPYVQAAQSLGRKP